jgi:hypothetical protein
LAFEEPLLAALRRFDEAKQFFSTDKPPSSKMKTFQFPLAEKTVEAGLADPKRVAGLTNGKDRSCFLSIHEHQFLKFQLVS